MIGWALRRALLWGGIAVLCTILIGRSGTLFRPAPAVPVSNRRVEDRAGVAAPPIDSMSYPVDARGHVVVEAEIDGARLYLLVDTGAGLVSLTPQDARAAGVETSGLAFTGRAATANGITPMAPVSLREIRVGQLVLENVPAAVFANLDVSLLGMSFLSRLRSYRMGDGRFTIAW